MYKKLFLATLTCLLAMFVMIVNVDANVLWVNYNENVYKSDMVTYATDYMFIISQDKEIPLVAFQEPVQEAIKKPLISIMVSSLDENKVEFQKKQEIKQSEAAKEKASISDYTVYFDFDSAKLRKDQISVLNKIPLKGGEIASIYGYTCPIGKADHNKKLSKRRAKAVANYLQKRGVAIGEVVGMGETGKEK
ncbi:OmpA family protein, partial [Thermodesulfovibrio sp. 1176]|uniref:OmpA family protein n=1 Tax=Thermodesulfovibrio sp. 1176 TaxID=3043424 RepID=UPI00248277B3